MSSILIYGGVYVSRFRVLAFTLIFSLCLSFSSWAVTDSILYDSDGFAKQVNTYKDLALSASDAIRNKSWDDNVSVASSVSDISNFVDWSGAYILLFGDGVQIGRVGLSVAGTFSFRVPAGKTVNQMDLYIHPQSLPVMGNYRFNIDFASDTTLDYTGKAPNTGWFTFTSKAQPYIIRNFSFQGHTSSGGDTFAYSNISLQSSVSKFTVQYKFSPVSANGAIGGKFKANFNPSQYSSTGSTTSPGTAPSTSDIQSGIASTTTQIASSVNEVYESIQQLMQHISNQLAALWDQMYNYMHVPTYNKLQEILQAIQAIQLKVNVDVSSVVDAVDNSADRITDSVNSSINNQISNDNKNADDIKNGYDNSGMKADNDRLNDKISQYDNVEDQLFDDAKDKIGNFTFDNPLTKYTDVLSDISYFLSGIYTALGALNIPVGFSLTLTIALIFIGYYRFKGGA